MIDETVQNIDPNITPTKEEIAMQKKEKFLHLVKKIKMIALITIFVIILIVLGRFIFLKTKKSFSVIPDPKPTPKQEEVVKVVPPEEVKDDTWEKFASEKYKFEVSYPKLSKFSVSEETNLIKIIYEKTLPEANVNYDTLVGGYFVTINPLDVAKINILQAAELKLGWYKNSCPLTAEFSQISNTQIGSSPAVKFFIKNCNSDLDIYFVKNDNYIYEITLVIKGDLGFKQHFVSEINQIFNSFTLYLDAQPEPDPFIVYSDKRGVINFTYPRLLNSTCCAIPRPIPNLDGVEDVIFLSQSDNDHVLAIFLDTNKGGFNKENYIANQINLLSDDFKIIKGYSPSGAIEEIDLEGKIFTKLTNYYWKGQEIYYLKSTKSDRYLVITKNNFDSDTFYEILKSIKFN